MKRFYEFLKKDTLLSWFVSLILIIIFIKLIFFPSLSFITGTPLPLVVVESCSMYHETNFDNWWTSNEEWYEGRSISKKEFLDFPLRNGLNKGDIVFVYGRNDYNLGDVLIFTAPTKYPLIHRIVSFIPLQTKGDHNAGQLSIETKITNDQILGKAVFRIPFLGWVKLIFFEPFREPSQRGFCK